MDHWWDCERLDEFFNRVVKARLSEQIPITPNLLWLLFKSRIQNRQRKGLARTAAEVHYNIDVDIFEATFDRRLNGSCGHWKDAQTLDGAQEAKLDLICHKAQLQSGQRVLDIGSGWGAFTGFAAERFGVEGVGVSVSSVQVVQPGVCPGVRWAVSVTPPSATVLPSSSTRSTCTGENVYLSPKSTSRCPPRSTTSASPRITMTRAPLAAASAARLPT